MNNFGNINYKNFEDFNFFLVHKLNRIKIWGWILYWVTGNTYYLTFCHNSFRFLFTEQKSACNKRSLNDQRSRRCNYLLTSSDFTILCYTVCKSIKNVCDRRKKCQALTKSSRVSSMRSNVKFNPRAQEVLFFYACLKQEKEDSLLWRTLMVITFL